MIIHLIIFLLSFAGIWIGSGLAIKSVEGLSKSLKVSSFAVSFFILGLFTSITELSVGINSIVSNDPEIYVGNLIGASIVLFMLVIPLLAITGSSIRIRPEFQGFNLPASLVVIALPVLLVIDGSVSQVDSIIAISLYAFLIVIVETKNGLIEKFEGFNPQAGMKFGKELLKILLGVTIIFIASRFVVEQTLYFSNLLSVSPFLISLLLIGIGTNIPELSLVVRSAFMRNHQVAFGDYVGSAAFNTYLLGFLTIIYGKPVRLTNNYLVSLLYLIVGLAVFYHFARTKNSISRREGVILLLFYLSFLITETITHL